MKKFLPFIIVMLVVIKISAQQVVLLPFASGFTAITDIKNAGDDRLFVVEQAGRIKITDLNGTINPVNFLNITNKVTAGGERGLLGLAFSPDYENDGYFYVNYTNTSGNTVISRFSVSGVNPDKADSLSEMILLTINQPFTNHNGGHLTFGPDGYLYIGMGDGGSGGDPQNNGQTPSTLLGKMLRIDVSGGGAYTVPADNPFVGVAGYLPEVWAMGLRNPWRFSFDRWTDDMWIADVGQGLWEEINFQPASSAGGENWGWRCYEGNVAYNTSGCQPMNSYDFPVHVYPHSGPNSGCSVSGGYVYRGAEYPTLFGRYFYADYCSGLFGSINVDNNCSGTMANTYYGNIANINPTTFGEDRYGNLYIGGSSGLIRKIADTSACMPVAFITCEDSLTVCGTSYDLITPAGNGFLYQWYSDSGAMAGADTSIVTITQSGSYNVVVVNAEFCMAQSQWVYVDLITPPTVSFSGLSNSYCESDTPVVLSGMPAGGIFTGNGVTGATADYFDPLLAGAGVHLITYTYSDTATGCEASATQTVTVFGLPAQPQISQTGDTLFSNVTGNLQWLDSTMTPIAGETGDFFLPQLDGTYYVQFTDSNGCTVISDPFVFLAINIITINKNLSYRIYPNPAGDHFKIDITGNNNSKIQLRLIEQTGRTIISNIVSGELTEIQTSELKSGVYYLELKTEKEIITDKIILINN